MKRRYFLISAALFLVTVFMLLPFFTLSFNIFLSDIPIDSFPNKKMILLLLHTVFFSLCVVLLGLFISIPAALMLANIPGKMGYFIRLTAVSTIAVPPYLHALAWQQLFQKIDFVTSGDIAALWVETLVRLPVFLSFILLGFNSVNSNSTDMAYVYKNPLKVFVKIILPQIKPFVMAAASIVLIFSINDYGLPALFLRSSYILDLFSQYSATGNSKEVFVMALPFIAVSAVLAMIAVNSISKISIRYRLKQSNSIYLLKSALLYFISVLALLILFVQFITPIGEIFFSAFSSRFALDKGSLESLKFTLEIAIVSSVATIPFAWFIAEYLHRNFSYTIWIAILISFSLSPTLTGIGSIYLLGSVGGNFIYNGKMLLIFGYIIRLMPISILLIYLAIRNSNQLVWDMARVYQYGWKLWFKIRFFQIWAAVFAALIICFSLVLSDIELSLLLSPPGMTSVGVRLFNYLHYGASEQVGFLSLIILVIMLFFGGVLYTLATKSINKGNL